MSDATSIKRKAGSPAALPEGTIAELFLGAVDTFGKPDAVRYKDRSGAWRGLSHRRIYDDVKATALGLEALGLSPGDRVAILSENRPEWLISDFACVMSRTISVPLYPVLPADQIGYMLRDSGSRAVFVSDAEQAAKAKEAQRDLPGLRHVVSYDEGAASGPDAISFTDLVERGRERIQEKPDAAYRARALEASPHDLLTVIYTSGTTGQPKGVMLTHNNLFSNVRGVLETFDISEDDVSLSILPLCHIFERMAGHYVMVDAGVSICYAESFAAVGQNMLEVRPTVMTMVPRGYEKMYARIEEVARAGGSAKLKVLAWAKGVGARHLEHRLAGGSIGPVLKLGYALADRLVFSKVRKQTGGRMRFFVSGGAPLSPELARFFNSAGLTVLEGYGLTETSPVIAFNQPGAIKIGTVGRPIPGVEVAIAEDGEILTRGPHVMKGYHGLPDATAAAIDEDGWFHTGDVGEIDDEGYLSVTDRKKDLIITAGGKNIAPQPVENRAKNSPFVDQVVMLGDKRRFPVLLIVPDFEALAQWARSQGIETSGRKELVEHPDIVAFMEAQVLDALEDLARYEQPKKIGLLPEELKVETGEITPTLKVRRRIIEEKYQDLIDRLYAD